MKRTGYPLTKWKFRKDAQSQKNWIEVFYTITEKIQQFHRIKSNKEVTLKTRQLVSFTENLKTQICKKNIFTR